MFLKELYISGFKSFANPSKLTFDQEISAIVGPNGSGKSNISDAIRFVLGEQRTKQMRSQKMEDIIFSGTSTESPRGAAEVKLTLKNEEEPDLVVSRKLFRTGESEYQINGRKVRLKDIHSLFADTGLGRNGYSIVSQGGVENIVGATPTQIREMVEEAVGIAGYKAKRDETQHRLKQTRDNINRITDILDEVSRQLKSLKVKAEKTRRYLEINEILRVIDLVSFFHEQTKNIDTLNSIESQLKDTERQLKNLDSQSLELEESHTDLKKKAQQANEEIETCRNELNLVKEKIIDNREKQIILKQKIEYEENEVDSLKQKIKDLEKEIEESDVELSDVLESIGSKKKDLSEYSDKLEVENAELEKLRVLFSEISSKNKTIQDQKEERERINKELSDQILINQSKLDHNQTLKVSYEREIAESLEHERTLKREYEKTSTEITDLNSKLEGLKNSLSEVISSYNRSNQQALQLKERKNKLDNDRLNLENQLSYQEKLQRTYSGYNTSVRSIMQYTVQSHISGVFGPIAELYTTDRKYQTAVQVALGNRSQNIVVDSDQTAQKLIKYLNNNKKGRATFLPIASLSFNQISGNLLNDFKREKGFLAIAVDVIRSDKKVKRAFDSLLSRTIIIDTFTNAQSFRKKFKSFTVVTLAGEIFYPGGAIVGGSISKDRNIFQDRKNEIESLKNKLQLNKRDQENISLKLSELKPDLSKLSSKREKVSEEIGSQQKILYSLEEKIKFQKRDLDRETTKRRSIEMKKNSIDDESLRNAIIELKKSLSDLNDDKVFDLKETSQIQDDIIKQNDIVSQNRLKVSLFENELSNLNTESQRLRDKMIKALDLKEETTRLISEKEASIHSQKNELKELKGSSDLSYAEEEKKTALFNQKRDLRVKLDSRLNDIEERIKSNQHQRNLELESQSKLQRNRDKVQFNRKNLNDSIFETYNVNYALVKEEIDELEKNRKDLSKDEIRALRTERKQIGYVSTDSIEEYLEQKKRHENLQQQYEDLIIAEKNIVATIDEINRSMTDELTEKFMILNKRFDQIFSILFEGGKASLSFVNPQDVLNSGIELTAQPPGKNLKSLNLLSGGEKAMTAIALLLAFIELNPAPFVIIDEIDAALDDSNIKRFTNYLKFVCTDNQFIIITHRKTTLFVCNKINGVSMNHNGISKLCSIELSEFKEE